MRCSIREPAMFTSTPIQKPRNKSEFRYFENSPIPKLYKNDIQIPEQLVKYQDQKKQSVTIFKVLGNQKIPLFGEERKRAVVFNKQVHPPMVVVSDSEEEDKIYKEITSLQSQLSKSLLNPLSSNKSGYKNMDTEQLKDVTNKLIRNRSIAKPLKEDISEPESKKSMRRNSRVATIVDEVMKKKVSTIVPSPIVKSEDNVDAVVKERKIKSGRFTRSRTTALPLGDTNLVRESRRRKPNTPNFSVEKDLNTEFETEKLTNLETIEETNTRKARKRTKNIVLKNDEKENDTQYNKDPQPGGQTITPLKNNNLNIIHKKNEAADKKLPSIEKILNTDKKLSLKSQVNEWPVIYKQEDIKDNEWMQVAGQKGVFVKKNFVINNISNTFVKIESKCSFNLNSPKFQMFCVVDGRGIFSYDDVKDKVGPGQAITIPSGVSCEIRNTGIKKNMILSITKVN